MCWKFTKKTLDDVFINFDSEKLTSSKENIARVLNKWIIPCFWGKIVIDSEKAVHIFVKPDNIGSWQETYNIPLETCPSNKSAKFRKTIYS